MSTPAPSRSRTAVVLLALALAALCLRGPIAAVGPLIADIESAQGLLSWQAAILTGLPLVMFGVLAPFAPGLAARIGLRGAVVTALGLIGIGEILRAWSTPGLFAGTLLIGAGIATGNVLLVVVAKAELGPRWPYGVAVTTGVLAISASLGAAGAVHAEHVMGDPLRALALWIVPVGIALIVWLVIPTQRDDGVQHHRVPFTLVFRDPIARSVALYFGTQSLMFYSLLTWFVAILVSRAASSQEIAGVYVGLMVIIGLPTGLLVPKLVMRTDDQRPWVMAFAGCLLIGVGGLIVFPGAPVAWAVFCGIGCGGSFPLALTLVGARTSVPEQTAALSAAAQSVGYLFAACGPPLVGILLSVSGDWLVPLLVLVVVAGLQAAVGLKAGAPGFIDSTSSAPMITEGTP